MVFKGQSEHSTRRPDTCSLVFFEKKNKKKQLYFHFEVNTDFA